MINYGVFVKEDMFNGKKIFNNALILATVHLFVRERAALLEQKIELRMARGRTPTKFLYEIPNPTVF